MSTDDSLRLTATWSSPASSSLPVPPSADGAIRAAINELCRRIGLPQLDIDLRRGTGDSELTLSVGAGAETADPIAEQVAFGMVVGYYTAIPDQPSERWAAVANAGPDALVAYVGRWATIALQPKARDLLDEAMAAAIAEQVGAAIDVPEVVSALNCLLADTSYPIGDWSIVEQAALQGANRPSLTSELVAAAQSCPIELRASRDGIRRLAREFRRYSSAIEQALGDDIGGAPTIVLPPLLPVVDEAIPANWLIVRHGWREFGWCPLPAGPEGVAWVDEVSAISPVYLPGLPTAFLEERDDGDLGTYLFWVLRGSLRAVAGASISAVTVTDLFDVLAERWDEALVYTLRAQIGDEAVTWALRRWFDTGRPVATAHVLLRELLAVPSNDTNEIIESGIEAAFHLVPAWYGAYLGQ